MKKILVVEDDQSIAEVLRIILEGEGYVVVNDPTGDRVIKNMIESADLALVDYLLPGKSGKDVIEAIRKSKKLNKIPIILMSANTEPELAKIAEDCGVASFIPKPFDILDLTTKVKSLLFG